MNKICTTIEQSKKLLELGIDVNIADMHYYKNSFGDYIEGLYNSSDLKEGCELKGIEYIPAWSLSALVEILSDITDYSFELIFLKRTTDGRGDVLENIYRCSVDMKDTWNTEPIDAIFEMIVWLKEN